MSDLPEVRPTSCGHGFVLVDVPPAARVQNGNHLQDVYLCEDCRSRLHRPKVETKDIRPDEPLRDGDDVRVVTKEYVPATLATGSPGEAVAAVKGREAALAGEPRRVPDGIHPRSSWAREWLAAYDEVKGDADGKPTGGA